MKTIGIYAYIDSNLSVVGGIEAQVFHLALTLEKLDFNVVIHCLKSTKTGLSFQKQHFVFQTEVKKLSQNIQIISPNTCFDFDKAIQENIRLSKQENEDIIFSFDTRDGYISSITKFVKEELSIPLITFVYFTTEERWWRSHFIEKSKNTYYRTTQNEQNQYLLNKEEVLQNILHISDLIIVPTHYVKGQIITNTGFKYGDKIKICYHGVPETQGFNTKWKNIRTFLYASRMSVPISCDKGFLWALETFYNMPDTLHVCGAGNFQNIMPDFSSSNIHFNGLISQKELFQIMKDCSFALVPSMMEAGCTFAVECASHNCLPLALDFAGLAEIMEAIGLEDYLLSPQKHYLTDDLFTFIPNTDKFKQKLCSIDEKKVNSDLKKAQQIIASKYTVTKTTNKLLQLIQEHL